MGFVELALIEQGGSYESLDAARGNAGVLEKIEIGEVVACVGEAARACAGAGSHNVGFFIVVRVDQVGFAGLKRETAISECGPDLDSRTFIVVIIQIFAAVNGFYSKAD